MPWWFHKPRPPRALPVPVLHGIAGDPNVDLLGVAASLGATVVRTWGLDQLSIGFLQSAATAGVSVYAGVWITPYTTSEEVSAQVSAWAGHSAIVAWILGNELETRFPGDEVAATTSALQLVNALAPTVKTADPLRRKVFTALAEIGTAKAALVERFGTELDGLVINAFESASSLPTRLAAQGSTKPYLVGEWSVPGWWSARKTQWGAPYEASSTSTAVTSAATWASLVQGAPGAPPLLGTTAFFAGHKVEGTPTWFSLFSSTGEPAADRLYVLSRLWHDGGLAPENVLPALARAGIPGVAALRLTAVGHTVASSDVPGTGLRVASGSFVTATVSLPPGFPSNDSVVTLLLVPEGGDDCDGVALGVGGAPGDHRFVLVGHGAARVFAYVRRGGQPGFASVNVPVWIEL